MAAPSPTASGIFPAPCPTDRRSSAPSIRPTWWSAWSAIVMGRSCRKTIARPRRSPAVRGRNGNTCTRASTPRSCACLCSTAPRPAVNRKNCRTVRPSSGKKSKRMRRAHSAGYSFAASIRSTSSSRTSPNMSTTSTASWRSSWRAPGRRSGPNIGVAPSTRGGGTFKTSTGERRKHRPKRKSG